jgi:hypothetical protein
MMDPDAASCPVCLEHVGATADGVIVEHERIAADVLGYERISTKGVYCTGSRMDPLEGPLEIGVESDEDDEP